MKVEFYEKDAPNTVENFTKLAKDGFYNSDFRKIVHDKIKEIGLKKNETIYGEIVGYSDQMTPLMGIYNSDDKEIKKLYGKDITFSYGCKPTDVNQFGNCFKVFIYRITLTNEDGYIIEYSWPQVKARCAELGLETVPEVMRLEFIGADDLLKKIQPYIDGPDPLDNSHPREGLVIRVEHEEMNTNLKIKGSTFCILESIRTSDDLFEDLEDIS